MANQPGKIKKMVNIPAADVEANGGYQPGAIEKVRLSGDGIGGGTVETAENALVRAAGSGGNARGNGAVDLQRYRKADTQVASGFLSAVLGGAYNTASGPNASVLGGAYNTASGPDTSVLGGQHNVAGGSDASVVGGYRNAVNGGASSVLGGQYNTANGNASSVLGGQYNTVNGNRASAIGQHMRVDGDDTHVIGVALSDVVFAQDSAFITYGLRAYLHAPNTAPDDADLKSGSVSFWLDESSNLLTFRCKYSDGTLKTGTVALT